mmetsp:Transcript_54590/g.90353  ORF Transcript_54590/g.90353 Transcript_54590/m.90353 type:complete len:436 (+) Transcript_54590:17-1324(+)
MPPHAFPPGFMPHGLAPHGLPHGMAPQMPEAVKRGSAEQQHKGASSTEDAANGPAAADAQSGAPSEAGRPASAEGKNGAASAEQLRALVRGVYERRNPAKLSELEGLFKKYAGSEMEVYTHVCQKYGETPQIDLGSTDEAAEKLPSVSAPSAPAPAAPTPPPAAAPASGKAEPAEAASDAKAAKAAPVETQQPRDDGPDEDFTGGWPFKNEEYTENETSSDDLSDSLLADLKKPEPPAGTQRRAKAGNSSDSSDSSSDSDTSSSDSAAKGGRKGGSAADSALKLLQVQPQPAPPTTADLLKPTKDVAAVAGAPEVDTPVPAAQPQPISSSAEVADSDDSDEFAALRQRAAALATASSLPPKAPLKVSTPTASGEAVEGEAEDVEILEEDIDEPCPAEEGNGSTTEESEAEGRPPASAGSGAPADTGPFIHEAEGG